MSFDEKLPKWDNPGNEPPESKKTEGWQATEKPPAQWFNWLFNRIYKVLEETRNKFTTHEAEFDAHKAENAKKHITEHGGSGDEHYIRFDDGTQIVYRRVRITALAKDEVRAHQWYYLKPFKTGNRPIVLLTPAISSGTGTSGVDSQYGLSGGADGLGPNHEGCSWAVKNLNASIRDMNMLMVAIGRWK